MPPHPNNGFKVPMQIPGAPERVTIAQLIAEAQALLRQSINVFLRRPGALETATADVTWWQYGLTVTTGAIISGVLFAIATIFIISRLPSFGLGLYILTPILVLILHPITMLIAFHAGCYASHWYATKQQQATIPLLRHCQTIALPWLAGTVFTSIVGAFSIILLGSYLSIGFLASGNLETLASLPSLTLLLGGVVLVISIYTLVIIFGALKDLYRFEGIPLWLTFLLFVIVQNIVADILARILQI